MGDLENRQGLSKGQQRLEGFEQTEELAMGEEDRDEEDRSEGYDSPQEEGHAIIC